jgi:ubiquinone/menaquinone biosynthesis C-methylase UbiE
MEDVFKKAKMFNEKASKKKSKPDIIINKLEIKKGYKIADIGSGGGYFTFRFAKIVKNEGHVYSIDTNKEFLKYIEIQAKKYNLNNITTIHTIPKNPKLPTEKLDYFFLRNVFHHIPDRINYFRLLGKGLKTDGKIIIIEHNGKGLFNFNKIFGHFVDPNTIKNIMYEAGYRIYNEYDFINQQSFIIFIKK